MEIIIALLVVLIPLAAMVVQLWQYIDQKKVELRDKRFEYFHRLIRELVEPSTDQKMMYLDRQIAVVFELRNFPEYAEVSERILIGLRDTWSKNPESLQRMITEIDLTLAYLRERMKKKKGGD